MCIRLSLKITNIVPSNSNMLETANPIKNKSKKIVASDAKTIRVFTTSLDSLDGGS